MLTLLCKSTSEHTLMSTYKPSIIYNILFETCYKRNSILRYRFLTQSLTRSPNLDLEKRIKDIRNLEHVEQIIDDSLDNFDSRNASKIFSVLSRLNGGTKLDGSRFIKLAAKLNTPQNAKVDTQIVVDTLSGLRMYRENEPGVLVLLHSMQNMVFKVQTLFLVEY